MKIDHIAMYVNDLEAAKTFFETYFEASANELYHNQTTNFKSYFLSFENDARLEIMTRPEVNGDIDDIFSTGLIHLAFSVGSKEKVDELTRRLEQDGYEVHSGPRTTSGGYYESCIIGFEGNLIEITI